jgi:hypothetical protein
MQDMVNVSKEREEWLLSLPKAVKIENRASSRV